jgi:hypothetical protein
MPFTRSKKSSEISRGRIIKRVESGPDTSDAGGPKGIFQAKTERALRPSVFGHTLTRDPDG